MTSLRALCRIPVRSSQIPLTQHICDVEISFLQKLSTLEFLDFSLAEVSFSNTEQYPCCPLPHLNSYGGFASLMPCFISGSTVHNVLIICPTLPPKTQWIEFMECLWQSAIPLHYFNVFPFGFQTDMILMIPNYLQDLCELYLVQKVHKEQVCGYSCCTTC